MKFAALIIFVLITGTIHAQEPGGEFSIGPRFGGSTGLSVKKHNAGSSGALEFIAGWNFDEAIDAVIVNVLFEKLAHFSKTKRFSAMLGIGPGIAFADEFRLGLAGILGIDWRVTNPINLQFDWQPTWYFVNGNDFSATNLAFTIRWNFRRNK